MHTDEYGITLSREVHACEAKVGYLSGLLSEMERKYGVSSETFMEEYRRGERAWDPDFTEWSERYEEFLRWKDRLREYRELYAAMR